jgi:hypothetical protein
LKLYTPSIILLPATWVTTTNTTIYIYETFREMVLRVKKARNPAV